jgi:small subunit ribosomal protein S6
MSDEQVSCLVTHHSSLITQPRFEEDEILDALRQYELMFIVDPDAADDEVTKITDSLKQIVTDQGGTVTKEENLGRRQLAYEILHRKDGIFLDLEIEGSGREIAELERRMRVNDRILRYLTVRLDEDRRRAEKFKDKRARKAAKRPFGKGGSAPARGAVAPEFPVEDAYDA